MSGSLYSNPVETETIARPALQMGSERLAMLSHLSVLLNSSLNTRNVIKISLEQLKQELKAEAATLFLLSNDARELTFWAFQGTGSEHLRGQTISVNKGIVGWVIQNQAPTVVKDVTKDSRFFGDLDQLGQFKTRNLICVPLVVGGRNPIGAIEVLNCVRPEGFSELDVEFISYFGHLVALAVDNSRLYEEVQKRYDELLLVSQQKERIIIDVNKKLEIKQSIITTNARRLLTIIDQLSNEARKLTKLFLSPLQKKSLHNRLYELALELSRAQEELKKEVSKDG